MTALAIGIAIGIVLLGAVLVATLLGPDPPAEPGDAVVDDSSVRDSLFHPPGWTKGRVPLLGGAPAEFNRPLDVQALPNDGILPPPRQVQGVNGE